MSKFSAAVFEFVYILLIVLLVVQGLNRKTIHPTRRFILMNLLQMPWVIT
jgi:hypothetical protein